MKLINQSFEILKQTDFSLTGIKKFIEKCYNIYYPNEEVTDNSYEFIINNIIRKKYNKLLELGTVHLKLPMDVLEQFYEILESVNLLNCQWFRFITKESSEDNEYYAYMTTDYKHYLLFLDEILSLYKYLDSSDSIYYPKRYIVHFITSKNVINNIISNTELSSQYVDILKNELTFVIPNWTALKEGNYNKQNTYYSKNDDFLKVCFNTENIYSSLINEKHCTFQEIIDILPLGIKSELILCGFRIDWRNFFSKIYTDNTLSMTKEIINSLQNKFKELGYI